MEKVRGFCTAQRVHLLEPRAPGVLVITLSHYAVDDAIKPVFSKKTHTKVLETIKKAISTAGANVRVPLSSSDEDRGL